MVERSNERLNEFERALSEQANALLEHVQRGDFSSAVQVISELNETRDRTLYQEVGRLTRTLHEAIRNFHIDAGGTQASAELSQIADASDRLSYVIELTHKAANRTMDLVEGTMPIANSISADASALKQDWERLRRRELAPEEFRDLYRRMDVFLGDLAARSDQLSSNLSDILLAQDYQDLTGQVIQKVTSLVNDVESNLVNLVVMAGQVDKIAGTRHELDPIEKDASAGYGPQIKPEKSADVVASQDDVDDLLSSLGF